MKKITLALLGLAFAGSCAFAQTNQVLSRNAVGYVKLQVETGKLYLARLDFEPLNGVPFTVTNLIGDQLPQGSGVLLWDGAAQSYLPINKTRSGWSPGTNVISRGESFFVRGPASGSSTGYTVFLMGEVPDRFTAPTTTAPVYQGLGMFGFPYPVEVLWTNTTLAQGSAQGDGLLVWDAVGQTYVPYNKTRSGWGTADSLVIQPGQGFWFRKGTAGTTNWIESKPYTWP